ncbi:hypothetical protein [Nonomuraea rhizosphaerae]|uniref:hypothetical protein n=1 Tax=Nonomuraea rhizosphaerae TaxID=2665663 RepID=UPI001C5DD4C0|nr:hypothetical protein [Nonomuraea rhizosphaerae]
MEETALDYADFAEYDRRQRGIERHMLAAFLGGLAVGLVGMLTAGRGPLWLGQLYDPYMYLVLALLVGASAAGFGWALLGTSLAALSTIVAAMGGSALRGGSDLGVIGGDAAGTLNWTLALLVGLGLLAYVTRRRDGWGDVAAGAIGTLLLADVIDRATPGFIDSEPAFWPGPALVAGVLSAALVLALRRSWGSRLRALAMAAVLAAAFTFAVTGAPVGWIPVTV